MVFTVGVKVNEPSAGTASCTPVSVTVCAFVVSQRKTVDWPRTTVEGEAVNESQLGASGVVVTVTGTLQSTVPFVPVTVRM